MTPSDLVYAAAPGFADVTSIIQGRCSMCHAREPAFEGIHWAPKGVVLETPSDIAREAHRLGLDAGMSHSCYDPAPDGSHCGHCDACLLRARGFAEAGLTDPTVYA